MYTTDGFISSECPSWRRKVNAVIDCIFRATLVGCLLLSATLAVGSDEDDKKPGEQVPQKLEQAGVQQKQPLIRIGKYQSLLGSTKWKATDFFELQHNLDMCQAIADEDYKVIDAATKEQVNSQERYGLTILHWAFLTGDHVAFEKLLKRGADLHLVFTDDVKEGNVIFMKGTQFLFATVHHIGYGEKFLEISLDYISDPDCRCLRNNGTLLHEYILTCISHGLSGSSRMVKRMLEAGCDPSAVDSTMRTPCALAAAVYMPDLCLLMLDYGADPTIKNDKGEDLKAVVERLLKKGVPVPPNEKDLTEGYRRLAERVGADVDFDALKGSKAAKE